MQIKILKKDDIDDKLKTRHLYEECFDFGEDEYINYYYDVIIKRNEIVALFGDNDEVISMVHLNPYRYHLFDRDVSVHYLVAVATKKEYRGKGYMKMTLDAAIDYLKSLGEVFCYIVPSNDYLEKTYSKFGFETVCSFTVDKFSKEKYDIYPVKDEEYTELMVREQEFLDAEDEDYRRELSSKKVMFNVFDSKIRNLLKKNKNLKIYVCQEV